MSSYSQPILCSCNIEVDPLVAISISSWMVRSQSLNAFSITASSRVSSDNSVSRELGRTEALEAKSKDHPCFLRMYKQRCKYGADLFFLHPQEQSERMRFPSLSALLLVAFIIIFVGGVEGVSNRVHNRGRNSLDSAVAQRAPTFSVVFITKRPGGYDVLFNMLLAQTDQDFELLLIDDLGQHRREEVLEYAKSKNIKVTAFIPSKPKDRGTKFGQFNAINTGVLISSGRYIVILQDNIWLPSNFFEKTREFYNNLDPEKQDSELLGYPEQRYDTPQSRLLRDRLHDPSTITVFSPELESSPSSLGWGKIDFYATMTNDVLRAMGKTNIPPFTTWWWECAACTVPFEVLAKINGLDEVLDKGDDAQEVNIKDRALLIGSEVWNMPEMVIDLIDHHAWEKDEQWARFEGDTNIHRWSSLKDKMAHDVYPFISPNSYNLSEFRRQFHPLLVADGITDWTSKVAEQRQNGVASAADDSVFVDTTWSNDLPPNSLFLSSVEQQQWLSDALKDTLVFKPQFLFIYSLPPDEEAKWGDGFSHAFYLLRKNFHINPFNIFGWRDPAPGTWNVKMKQVYHFMLGFGPLGGDADRFLTTYDKFDPGPNAPGNDGTPTKKGFVISHGGGRKTLEPYKVVFYPTPWHESRIKKRHSNARHAIGINPIFFGKTKKPVPASRFPCPPLVDGKKFCREDGARNSLEEELKWPKFDVVVVSDIKPEFRVEKIMEKEGRRLVLGNVDESCEECAELADRLADNDVEILSPRSAEERADLLRSAGLVYFPQPADGGGEMTLLESLACGAEVEIEPDNERLISLQNGFETANDRESKVNWDSEYVAHQIMYGIYSVLHPQKGF